MSETWSSLSFVPSRASAVADSHYEKANRFVEFLMERRSLNPEASFPEVVAKTSSVSKHTNGPLLAHLVINLIHNVPQISSDGWELTAATLTVIVYVASVVLAAEEVEFEKVKKLVYL